MIQRRGPEKCLHSVSDGTEKLPLQPTGSHKVFKSTWNTGACKSLASIFSKKKFQLHLVFSLHILLNLTRISDVSRQLLVFSFCLFYIKEQTSLRWALTDLGHPCMAVGLGSDPSLPSGSMVLSRHTWEALKLKRRNLSKQLKLPKGIQFWLLCNFYLQSLFTSPGRMTGEDLL